MATLGGRCAAASALNDADAAFDAACDIFSQLEHAEFTTEEARERRAISGFKKQETEHEKKLARDAAAAESAEKKTKAEKAACAEAATHVVPPPTMLSEIFAAKLSMQEGH